MRGIFYQGYTAATSEAEAREAFVCKYGYQPQEILINKGAVLAGPIEEQEEQDEGDEEGDG